MGAKYLVPYSYVPMETYFILDLRPKFQAMAFEDHCLSFDAYYSSTFTVFLSGDLFSNKTILFITSDSMGLHFTRQNIFVSRNDVFNVGRNVKLVFASKATGGYSSIVAAISNVSLNPGNCLVNHGRS